MAKRLVVHFRVAPDQENDFNEWYENEYIPRFVREIPDIDSVSRWKTPDAPGYLTIYDLDPAADLQKVSEAISSPSRDNDRQTWHKWETSALSAFHDGLYEETFALDNDGRR
jgi:hypothetical protein